MPAPALPLPSELGVHQRSPEEPRTLALPSATNHPVAAMNQPSVSQKLLQYVARRAEISPHCLEMGSLHQAKVRT